MAENIQASAGQAFVADAVAAAGIVKTGEADETMEVVGRYVATLTGPREECRDDYLKLRSLWEHAVLMDDLPTAGFIRDQMRAMEEVKWVDEFDNLVTNVGKIDLLDKYLSGSAYTAAFYLGLVDGGSTPTYNAADTMASHAGWSESAAYSNSTRPAAAFNSATASGGGSGTAGTGSKATSATSFTINATATIAGCFLTTVSTKSGTTGTLYSAGSFTGGNRAVSSGDTLNVTYTAQA
ncbi:hypothetical protein [uncultured Alsobacter sp.]|uniref:hypothetical protein n=1 Tax=uncultured Alsobacter sp. TaxID=1748258 RepID=UPI0025FA0DF4|nr:hypothetical protein [uncultured Alsobacter sp.]